MLNVLTLEHAGLDRGRSAGGCKRVLQVGNDIAIKKSGLLAIGDSHDNFLIILGNLLLIDDDAQALASHEWKDSKQVILKLRYI